MGGPAARTMEVRKLIKALQNGVLDLWKALSAVQIASEFRRGYEYVWFTNPLPLASIPSVSCCSLAENLEDMSVGFQQIACEYDAAGTLYANLA